MASVGQGYLLKFGVSTLCHFDSYKQIFLYVEEENISEK